KEDNRDYPAPSFSPDGALLAATGVRGGRYVLCLWDVESAAEIKTLPQMMYFWWREHGRVLLTLGAKGEIGPSPYGTIRNPDGSTDSLEHKDETAFLAKPDQFKLWEIAHPTPTYLLDEHIWTASFSDDGSRLAVNDKIWEVRKNAEVCSLRRSAIQ